MTSFPDNYEKSWTISSPIRMCGVGLHSGENSEVNIFPSDKNGFYVSWDGSDEPPQRLQPNQIRESQLCTSIEIGNHRLSTVEHLLGALAGIGVTHAHIKVSGKEIPLLDGSALLWVEAIKESGLKYIDEPRKPLIALEKPLIFCRGESVITAIPCENFSLIGIVDFPYKAIGRQMLKIELTPDRFVKEIAPARTFGFRDQIDQLKSAGLIKGGGLQNALVCDGDHWVNPPLRFKDEPIRHKLLDLIGDLALVGFPQAQVLVYKGSHRLHADLASALSKESFL